MQSIKGEVRQSLKGLVGTDQSSRLAGGIDAHRSEAGGPRRVFDNAHTPLLEVLPSLVALARQGGSGIDVVSAMH